MIVPRKLSSRAHRQRGIALPVMMVMLAVMLVSSIYLLRSTNSTTLTTSNLAYDSALSKAADLGIHTGYAWLLSLGKARVVLQENSLANGYVANMNWGAGQGVNNANFWVGSRFIKDTANNEIEYVIHRLCDLNGPFDTINPRNNCALTSAKEVSTKGKPGDSLGSDSPQYDQAPLLHYVITARIAGVRGSNVMNQAVVMIGP